MARGTTGNEHHCFHYRYNYWNSWNLFYDGQKMSATDWDELICCAVVGMAGVGIVWWTWHGGRWW